MSNVYTAKLKLYRMAGREDDLWQKLSDHDREVLRVDTEEQRERDRQTIERYEQAHDTSDETTTSHATRAKAKLKSMVRIGRA